MALHIETINTFLLFFDHFVDENFQFKVSAGNITTNLWKSTWTIRINLTWIKTLSVEYNGLDAQI